MELLSLIIGILICLRSTSGQVSNDQEIINKQTEDKGESLIKLFDLSEYKFVSPELRDSQSLNRVIRRNKRQLNTEEQSPVLTRIPPGNIPFYGLNREFQQPRFSFINNPSQNQFGSSQPFLSNDFSQFGLNRFLNPFQSPFFNDQSRFARRPLFQPLQSVFSPLDNGQNTQGSRPQVSQNTPLVSSQLGNLRPTVDFRPTSIGNQPENENFVVSNQLEVLNRPQVQPQSQPPLQPQVRPQLQSIFHPLPPHSQPDLGPRVQPQFQPPLQPELRPQFRPQLQPQSQPQPQPQPQSPHRPLTLHPSFINSQPQLINLQAQDRRPENPSLINQVQPQNSLLSNHVPNIQQPRENQILRQPQPIPINQFQPSPHHQPDIPSPNDIRSQPTVVTPPPNTTPFVSPLLESFISRQPGQPIQDLGPFIQPPRQPGQPIQDLGPFIQPPRQPEQPIQDLRPVLQPPRQPEQPIQDLGPFIHPPRQPEQDFNLQAIRPPVTPFPQLPPELSNNFSHVEHNLQAFNTPIVPVTESPSTQPPVLNQPSLGVQPEINRVQPRPGFRRPVLRRPVLRQHTTPAPIRTVVPNEIHQPTLPTIVRQTEPTVNLVENSQPTSEEPLILRDPTRRPKNLFSNSRSQVVAPQIQPVQPNQPQFVTAPPRISNPNEINIQTTKRPQPVQTPRRPILRRPVPINIRKKEFETEPEVNRLPERQPELSTEQPINRQPIDSRVITRPDPQNRPQLKRIRIARLRNPNSNNENDNNNITNTANLPGISAANNQDLTDDQKRVLRQWLIQERKRQQLKALQEQRAQEQREQLARRQQALREEELRKQREERVNLQRQRVQTTTQSPTTLNTNINNEIDIPRRRIISQRITTTPRPTQPTNPPQNNNNNNNNNKPVGSLPFDSDNDGVPGEGGKHYPVLARIPKTSFTCSKFSSDANGYYADTEASCQVVHLCQNSKIQDSFLCPNGTIFNQEKFSCQWWFEVNCSDAPKFYTLNDNLSRKPKEQ